jgi:hypothetical protein
MSTIDGPDDYLDEVAIYRRMHGDKSVRLTRSEQVEVVRRMLATGKPKNEIERHTGLNVYRYLEAS